MEQTFPDVDLEKVLEGKPQGDMGIEDTVSRELKAEIGNIKTDERIKDAVIEFIGNSPHSLARFLAGDFDGYNLETAEELIKKYGKPEAAATIIYHNAAHVALFLATMKDNYKNEAVKIINRFVEVARGQNDKPDWDFDAPHTSIYRWTISHQIVAANIDEAGFVLREAIKNYKKRADYETKMKDLTEYFGDYNNPIFEKVVKPEKIEDLNFDPRVLRIKVLID